jgi:hypothetical protein
MATDIDRERLERLIANIAVQHFSPSEVTVFEIVGDEMIANALNGRETRDQSSIADMDGFGAGDIRTVVEIASLVAGTVKAIIELRKIVSAHLTSRSLEDVALTWQTKLVQAGLSEEKATFITSQFKEDLNGIL